MLRRGELAAECGRAVIAAHPQVKAMINLS
jgi:hypothetical protein